MKSVVAHSRESLQELDRVQRASVPGSVTTLSEASLSPPSSGDTTGLITVNASAAPRPLGLQARISGFIALTKPRLTVFVLITVGVGFLLGARGGSLPWVLFTTVLATGFVAGGASAWNQAMEWERDLRMRRTRNRPVPSGVVSRGEALVFGSVLTLLGLVLLAVFCHPRAALVAGVTFLLYVAIYTPLKPRTTLNTAIGAIPGALPPVIGWTAATGHWGVEAWSLFLIVFLWQFPHFLAIAWLHREDYQRAGYWMYPRIDPTGILTGRQAVYHALALAPAGLWPTALGLAGPLYGVAAILLGAYYLRSAVRFWQTPNDLQARGMLKASFIYLPILFLFLMLNPLPT